MILICASDRVLKLSIRCRQSPGDLIESRWHIDGKNRLFRTKVDGLTDLKFVFGHCEARKRSPGYDTGAELIWPANRPALQDADRLAAKAYHDSPLCLAGAGVRNAAVHPCTRPALPDSPTDSGRWSAGKTAVEGQIPRYRKAPHGFRAARKSLIVSAAELRLICMRRMREESMRTTLGALAFAAGISLMCCQSASAVPARTTIDGTSTAHLQQLAMMGAGGRDARQANRDAHSTHKTVKPKPKH
jgi:hypothetical protein